MHYDFVQISLQNGAILFLIDSITYKSFNPMLKGVNLIVLVADLAVHDDFVQIILQMGQFFLYFNVH